MPCTPLPALPAPPALPAGISLTPTLPAYPGGDVTLCCKILTLPAVPPPAPLPPLVWNAGVAAALETILAGVQSHLDAISFNCPRE